MRLSPSFRLVLGGLVLVLIGIAGIGWVLWQPDPVTGDGVPPAQMVYATHEGFRSVTSTMVMEEKLLQAFESGMLLRAAEWEVPGREGSTLVIASPTHDGTAQPIECGPESHPLCGLYLMTPDGARLLLWGKALTGFGDVLEFPDIDHALLGTASEILNLLEVRQDLVDLRDGSVTERLRVERDLLGEGATLAIWTENGLLRRVDVTESYDAEGQKLPESVHVNDGAGKEIFALPLETVFDLAIEMRSAPTPPRPLDIANYGKDFQKNGFITVQLYGIPFRLDITSGSLEREPTASHG